VWVNYCLQKLVTFSLPGSHHNNYGSTRPNNGVDELGRKEESGHDDTVALGRQFSPSKMTLRSNHLAALEKSGTAELEDDDANIYADASTLSINSATFRTKNRKVRTFSLFLRLICL